MKTPKRTAPDPRDAGGYSSPSLDRAKRVATFQIVGLLILAPLFIFGMAAIYIASTSSCVVGGS